jgi:hypothetical protein
VDRALSVKRLVLSELGVEDHYQQAWPGAGAGAGAGAGDDVERGRYFWVIFLQRRQANFSRTAWTTFHCCGTTSYVSVTSSPSSPAGRRPHRDGENH